MSKSFLFATCLLVFNAMASTPPPPKPTGQHNSMAYFDSSGNLNSNVNDRLNSSNGWLVISTLGTGATTGNIGATGGPGAVIGKATGVSSIVSTAFGDGQLCVGAATGNGQVSTQGNGSFVAGYATGAAIVATELDGSITVGRADTSAQISANGTATQAFGYADGSSILGANGSGSTVFGYVTGSSTINTTTLKFGQLAGGYSASSGNTTTGGNGAFTWGYADSSGTVSASGDGAVAFGRAHGTSVSVLASGIGSAAIGYANSNSITASGNGSLAGGAPAGGSVTASGLSAIAWGDSNTGSGNLSLTTGLGNSNSTYAGIVGGRFASLSGQTATSWVSGDYAIVYGNGTSAGAKSNAFSVTKSGNIIGSTISLAGNGSAGSPSYTFTGDTTSGMFLVGAGDLGITVAGAQAMDLEKSTSGFGNVGMGGAASLSDNYPLLMQRTNASAGTLVQVSNATAAANSHATFQVSTDSNNLGNLSIYTTGSTVPPYISSMVIRPNGDTQHLTLIGGDSTTPGQGDVRVWTGGDYTSAGETADFNGDHTTKFFGAVIFPVQGNSSTPSTTVEGATVYNHSHVLCVYTGSSWVKAADGSTSCTF